ncbi:MAG: hypothetical protein ACYSUI_24355, partial [Planctomycetota bacterium]
GISTRLRFQPRWLTDMADALPGVEATAPSALSVDGELAFSLPNTNTQGVTYVEDFEGGSGFNLLLTARQFRVGAAPASNDGAETVAPPFFDETNAAELVWQDQYTVNTPSGPQIVGGLLPQQIDEQLRIQGTASPEPVLTMTLRMPEDRVLAPNPSPAPGPAWASIINVLSSSGQDFTTIEFLEFYVAVSDELADSTDLIIDLGTLSEDAFAIDSLGNPSGIDQLDREVDPPQLWSSAVDTGLWDTGCEADPGLRIFPLGDVRANCTRNNGLEDSEDLNQNSVLDSDERFFRYTVEIGDPLGPYFVREAAQIGGARFRLYRVPLRRPDHQEQISSADFQNVRHLRLTAVGTSNNTLVLARVRFLGSRWLKRGSSGVLDGLTDTTTVIGLETPVEVGPISTLDSRYQPPPGVTDQVANQTDQFGFGGVTINEQSLSIRFTDMGPNERAEVYLQYAQTPRNFLAYRSLRVWALGSEGPWGTTGQPLRFFVKLGEDVHVPDLQHAVAGQSALSEHDILGPGSQRDEAVEIDIEVRQPCPAQILSLRPRRHLRQLGLVQVVVADILAQLHEDAKRLPCCTPRALAAQRPYSQATISQEIAGRLRVLQIHLGTLVRTQIGESNAQRLLVDRDAAEPELVGLIRHLVGHTWWRLVARVERANRADLDGSLEPHDRGGVRQTVQDAAVASLQPPGAQKADAGQDKSVVGA